MTEDDKVAVICEVARSGGHGLSRDQRALVDAVRDEGYIARAEEDTDSTLARLKVTPAGQALLDARGVGANES